MCLGKVEEAQDLIDLASAIRERSDGRIKDECAGHVKYASTTLAQADKAKLVEELHSSAIALLSDCRVVGGSGFDLEPDANTQWELLFAEDRVVLYPPGRDRGYIGGIDWKGLRLIDIG